MTHTTVTSVYNEALREGATTQPNPFLSVPQLDPVKNVVVYIALIGALFAILVGVQSMLRERKSRVLNLILSRPIGMRSYVLAKFLGITSGWRWFLAYRRFGTGMKHKLDTGNRHTR